MITTTSKQIPIVSIHFEMDLQPWEISQFRGAVAEWVMTHKNDFLSEEAKSLFHNHQGSGKKLYYRYPLIQYRSENGKATIVGIGASAILVLQKIMMDCSPPLLMSGKEHSLRWENMHMEKYPLERTAENHRYRLYHWIALNDHNLKTWETQTGLTRRVLQMEKLLVGHILAFATAMEWQIPERFEVEVLVLQSWKYIQIHQTKMQAFNLEFRTPLLLPDKIGLGKSVSHGFGVLKRME